MPDNGVEDNCTTHGKNAVATLFRNGYCFDVRHCRDGKHVQHYDHIANQKRPDTTKGSRYGAATVIIEADQELHASQPDGSQQTVKLRDRKSLSIATADKIRNLPSVSQVVMDRSFTTSLAIYGVYKALAAIVPATPFPWLEPAYIAVIAASLVIALIASTAPLGTRLKK